VLLPTHAIGAFDAARRAGCAPTVAVKVLKYRYLLGSAFVETN